MFFLSPKKPKKGEEKKRVVLVRLLLQGGNGEKESDSSFPSKAGDEGDSPHAASDASADAPSELDLPDHIEVFQAVVDRAFYAPEPAPAVEDELRRQMDLIGQTLWSACTTSRPS